MLYDSVHTETHRRATNADTRTDMKAFRRGNVDDWKTPKLPTSLDYGKKVVSIRG